MPDHDGRDGLPAAIDFDEVAERNRRMTQEEKDHAEERRLQLDQDRIDSIEDTLRTYAPPIKAAPIEPLPDYVEPRAEVPRVGALSAEAIVRDFETTAKDIEAMAGELTEASNRCAVELVELTSGFGKMCAEIKGVVDHVKETAAMYREEAKLVFVMIEDTTLKMKEIRDLSTAMRDRLTTPASGNSKLPVIQYAHGGEKDEAS